MEKISLEDRLEDLDQRWRSITEVPEQPRSLLSIIGYGLSEQRQTEVYVNRILRYFLDSDEPHGMSGSFLQAFLEGLPAETGFREDLYEISEIVVDDQVSAKSYPTEKETSVEVGRPDILIQVPDEWFLLVELKFSAAETGTSFYCEADSVDGRSKGAYESGEYYLYLHQDDQPEAKGHCFANWTWKEFVQNVLTPFIMQHGPRFPQRTVNQLHALEYDLKEITGMSDHQQSEQEKAALYIEYYNTVTDISEAFETKWEAFSNNWFQRLYDEIDDQSVTDRWEFYEHNTDWGYIFKTEWWRRTDTFEPTAVPTDPLRVRVGFLHRLDQHRDLAIGENELKFQFRNTPPNRHLKNEETNFRDLFAEKFGARQEEIRAALPERATLTGNLHNQIEATYDIPVVDHPDFFSAYISALHTAFEEHALNNSDLVSIIDTIYHSTLEEFR